MPQQLRKLHLLKLAWPHSRFSTLMQHPQLMDDIHGSQTLWCQIFFPPRSLPHCVCKFRFNHIMFFFMLHRKSSFCRQWQSLLLQCKVQNRCLSAFQNPANKWELWYHPSANLFLYLYSDSVIIYRKQFSLASDTRFMLRWAESESPLFWGLP